MAKILKRSNVLIVIIIVLSHNGLCQTCAFPAEPDILERQVEANIQYQSFNLARGDYPFIAPVFFIGVPPIGSTWYRSKRPAPCYFFGTLRILGVNPYL